MIIDSKNLAGICTCGKTHRMATLFAIIEPCCLKDFDALLARHGVSGKRCAIYDSNTYRAKGLLRPSVQQEIVLNAERLHADEKATEIALSQIQPDVGVLVAVGAGTVHDITRYCAHKLSVPFVSCPTAASVDGFCSTVSAMTWHGNKTTLPGVAPALVIADVDVIRQAPLRLALSGVGDIIGKYTSLADWKIAHALTGEYHCARVDAMTRSAVDAVKASAPLLSGGDAGAFEQLTYGLLLSGLAMQMMDNSRPASASEHHISHLLEMDPPVIAAHCDALHGEKVGVAGILVSRLYHRLARFDCLLGRTIPYAPIDPQTVAQAFGEQLAEGILKENLQDCLEPVSETRLFASWPEIRRCIDEIPSPETVVALYASIGAKKSLQDIGVDEALRPTLFQYAPYVRNRLTLLRAMRMIRAEV